MIQFIYGEEWDCSAQRDGCYREFWFVTDIWYLYFCITD